MTVYTVVCVDFFGKVMAVSSHLNRDSAENSADAAYQNRPGSEYYVVTSQLEE